MWYSTSLAEVYYSNKACHILRPIEIPYNRELGIYNESRFITDYFDFEKSVNSDIYSFPVSETHLTSYYYVDSQEATYIKICNKLEEVLSTNIYKLPKLKKNQVTSRGERAKQYISRSKLMRVIDIIASKTKLDTSYFKRKKN